MRFFDYTAVYCNNSAHHGQLQFVSSVIFINENENDEKRENNEFVNEN